MKTRIPSIFKSILFACVLTAVPYALVPHAVTLGGYLDNGAEALACPIKVPVVVKPGERTIDAGDTAAFTVTVDVEKNHDDFFGPITVSVTGLPASGVTITPDFPVDLNYTKTDRSEDVILTIDTTSAVTPGTYTLTFKASAVYRGVTYEKYASAKLVINPPPAPCFSVDAHERKTIKAGEDTFFTTVVKWCEGYTGDVALSVEGLPDGVTYTFDDNPVSPNGNSDNGNAQTKLRIHSTCAAPPGEYTITVRGTSGGVTENDTATLIVTEGDGGFTITAGAQAPAKVYPGESAEFAIAGHFAGCFAGPVSLSVDRSTLPEGVTVESLSPGTIDAENPVATLRLTAAGSTPSGNYRITVTGTHESLGPWTTVVELTVIERPQEFSLSADPAAREIAAGDEAEFDVTGAFSDGFKGEVRLSAEGSPSGLSFSFSPESMTADSPGSALTVTTKEDTEPGTYDITITGTHTTLETRTTVVKLIVTKTSDFTLSATPNSRDIEPGGTATYTITVNEGGALPNYTVTFPEPWAMPGLTASIDPTSLNPTSATNSVTLTVETDATVEDGIYSITVEASGGGHTASVTVTLAINEAPVVESAGLTVDKSVSPSSAKVGGMLLYAVTITNTGRGDLTDVVVRDHMPAGVGYVKGSTTMDGRKAAEPSGTTTLIWEIDKIDGGDSLTLKYHGVVKPNISRGRSTNTVTVIGTDATGRTLTAKASADLGVSSEALDRKGKIKGKVFIDENGNGLKNVDEEGIAGVLIILESGERTTTDEEGLFQFDEVDSGQHLVAVDVRKLSKKYFVVGDSSKIVTLFSGGTGRTYFGLGRTGPTKEELEALKKAEEEKIKKEEEARKEEEDKKKVEEEKNAPKGTLFGNVFVDANGNGIFNPGEKLLEKVTVLLDSEKGAVTDKMGNYRFTRVKEGRHTLSIREDQQFKKSYRPAKKDKITVNVKAATNNRKDIPVQDKSKLKISVELTVR